jgi:hypothetical protein
MAAGCNPYGEDDKRGNVYCKIRQSNLLTIILFQMNNNARFILHFVLFGLPVMLLASCLGNTSMNKNESSGDSAAMHSAAVPAKIPKKARTNVLLQKNFTLTQKLLKGKIKSIAHVHYKFSDNADHPQKIMTSKEVEFYNPEGYLIELQQYKQDGRLDGRYTYKFDTKGHDTETDYYKGGALYGKSIMTYDEHGNEIEDNGYSAKGKLIRKTVYKYDEKGNIIEMNNYKEDGAMDQRFTYKYTENGNRKMIFAYKPDGSPYTTCTYDYDNDENILETDNYEYDGSIKNKWTSRYDAKGNKTEDDVYKTEEILDAKYTYKYDDKGNIIEVSSYQSNGSLATSGNFTKEYEYDKTGNLVKETKFTTKFGKPFPLESIETEIVYY